MDFLKSAVTSAISKGPAFPYTFGDRVDIDDPVWSLCNGTRREDGASCSIFSFDCNADSRLSVLAKNAIKKLRTLRHPGVLKVLDVAEGDRYTYIATERVTPLSWHIRRKSLSPETIKWGLFSIAKTIRFVNEEASSIHGNVRLSTVYTSESGEWKLGGFEFLSSMKDAAPFICSFGNLSRGTGGIDIPPETAKSGWSAIKQQPLTAVDAYQFGILVYEVFNGPLRGGDLESNGGSIPRNMFQAYKRLINPNPKARLSVGHFLDQGLRNGGFFETRLIKLTEGIESLGLQSESERLEFLGEIDEVADDLPDDFLKTKVLPELLTSVEYGGGGPKMFGLVMKLSNKLSEDEYQSRVTPVVVRLFTSTDRALRVCLLDNLPHMIDHLPQKVVNDKIFPQMVSGFTDVAPVVREETVKAVLTVINKLSDRIINGELLKYLAKTSNDEQPGIRTNTTICLGKIARNLGGSTRQKVLAAAFTRSLRDPFVHARNAALMALAATADIFSEEDCATRMLPALCPALIDKEKLVREQANKTFDVYLQRVRKYGATLPETAMRPTASGDASAGAGPRIGTEQNDKSWAGWAISSFTNKIAAARGEIQTSGRNESVAEQHLGRTTSAPELGHALESSNQTGSASVIKKPNVSSTLQPISASVTPSSGTEAATAADYFDDNNAIGDGDVDAWGAMEDLMEDDEADTQNEQSTSEPAAATSAPAPTTKQPSKSFVAYDDSGEPDFAGWLTAQAQSKSKKALPKGLSKKPNNRLGVAGRSATTGSLQSTTSASAGGKASKLGAAKPKAPATTKAVLSTAPKDTAGEDEEGTESNPWIEGEDTNWGVDDDIAAAADDDDDATSAATMSSTVPTSRNPSGGKTQKLTSATTKSPAARVVDTKPKDADVEDDDDEGGWGAGWG